jgi:catechol 2,3-dioxygenase
MTPPLGDIAHIGHAELLTPDLDGSVRFFTDYLGLTVNGQSGDSVYLRTFDDYEHHSLVLTAADKPGLRRTALRTSSEHALQRRVEELEAAGHTGRWVEDEPGIGKLYLTADPDGHEIALYWETEYYQAPPELKPALKNQPQAKSNRGVGVRRLDHINFLAADVAANADFHQHVLGARPTEQIQLDSGRIGAKWLTFNNKSYDVVYTSDWTGSAGRLHHIAFATDTREDILRAADLAVDTGVFIETGPHKQRHPADVLPVRLRAGRQPHRAVQPPHPARTRPRLAPDHLDRGRARQGAGMGSEDHRVLPHARHATAGLTHGAEW